VKVERALNIISYQKLLEHAILTATPVARLLGLDADDKDAKRLLRSQGGESREAQGRW
jgi:hypothetical protein